MRIFILLLLPFFCFSQEDNYKKFEMLYTLYDQEFNIINKIDLSLHLRDSLTFAYAYRTNHDYIIIESGYQDFIRKETLLDYHLFDEDGNFVDQITYTLRDGIDNKIRYGHFYPLVDIINKRLLLTRSMQREFTESTRFEIFSSEGDSLQLINTIEVEGNRDHFKTLYGTMMENGDLLLYVQQFVFEQGENQKILFISWVMLDGEKINIISNVKDETNQHVILYSITPNPSSHQITVNSNVLERFERLFEMRGAQALDSIDKTFLTAANVKIVARQSFDDQRHVFCTHGFTDQRAQPALTVWSAAEQDLIPILARFLDAEHADVADLMVTARVYAARDLNRQRTQIRFDRRQLLGDSSGKRNGLGVRE